MLACLLAGMGIRSTQRATNVGKQTIAKYRGWIVASGFDLRCPCGLSDIHRGPCSYRVSKSPKRQATLRRMHAAQTGRRRS